MSLHRNTANWTDGNGQVWISPVVSEFTDAGVQFVVIKHWSGEFRIVPRAEVIT